ncbi:hypothetical protein M409DRAFT_55229 [Zasmidium cellare ATCC 36951]|uniref:ceramidase n=1 Tax=Zasmidium cellare ATCC 36951 TaxID=1080233 RepID=A0A6A6CGS7_ZASCE|nr:uncharacterized protein M409DRAFT_55229 [Zasmidium cellare ATCC 36951]KAF2166394.1 hypothetical protein M409DRAFT_55229 [Zasmidium cellare ATCC 36951]
MTTAASSASYQLFDGDRTERIHNLRIRASGRSNTGSTTSSRASTRSNNAPKRSSNPDEPSRFVIDLSLPPEQRYLEVCTAFKKQLKDITPLFDEVVGGFLHCIPVRRVHQLARLLLRGIYDKEENRELKGISKAVGVDMHLLVSFNVLLDLLMGCTSGGALVRDGEGGTKMVHFRTLDWGMPSLRKLVVQLDFKRRQDGPIIASSITYAGYVGVLTGVRKDFSVSLNFRPNRNDKGKHWSDVKYYYHLLMVLLGWRRSISSQLRCFLMPQKQEKSTTRGQEANDQVKYWTYEETVSCIGGGTGKPLRTTACYLCFGNGQETTVIEKDRATATLRSNNVFIAITNNDVDHEDETNIPVQAGERETSLADIVNEGKDRRQCTEGNYFLMRQHAAAWRANAGLGHSLEEAVSADNITAMLQWYPTTNEMTHFACLMDPKEGAVRWCRRWARPATKRWIREHQGYQRSTYL